MTAEERQQRKYEQMVEGPLPGLIISLALPMIASNLVTSIYNMADTYFVGRLNDISSATSATGAVGVAYALQVMVQAVGFSFGNGTSNNVSRLLGAQKREEAKSYASTGMLTAMFIGIIFTAVCVALRWPLARFLGATDTILPYAAEYIMFLMPAAPFMIGSFCLNTLLRAQGNAMYAMWGLIVGGLINVGLDPLLIFGAGMGVSGAALATAVSQMIGFCILFVMNSERLGNLGIDLFHFRPSKERYVNIFHLGIPSLFRQGVSSVATIVLNNVAAPFGDAAIAAMMIANRVTQAVYSIMVGFGNGFMPVCGYNFGAKRYRRVRSGYLFSLCVTTVWLAGMAAVIFSFAPSVITLFRGDDPEVIAIGTTAMRMQCCSMPVLGCFLFCNTTSQALGYSGRATLLAVSRQGLFFVPVICLMAWLFGLAGIQMAQPVSDMCSLMISVPLTLKLLRSLNIPDGAEYTD